MLQLPEQFLRRMQERLGKDYPAFLASYERTPLKGLRVNTLKLSAEAFEEISPFPLGDMVSWERSGFYITEEKPGGDVCHFAGLYYLQEPSAMCAAPLLGVKAGERVLDLCAAPGGKTTQLAAAMRGEGVLIANEIDYGRAKVLSQNVERMGIKNCAVTSAAPETLAARFPAYFDKILVDAPCSGEGMFKKEPNAIPEWSEENVARSAARQSGILDEAAKMLRGGGQLVYSTCTFSEEEDEWQVEAFLRRHPDFSLLVMHKLYPHAVLGEGHFCALLQRAEGDARTVRPFAAIRNLRAERAFSDFAEDFFETPPTGTFHTLGDGRMYLIPAGMPDLAGANLLRCGVELGTWDGKNFKPAHAMAMALGRARRMISLDRDAAKQYLRGEMKTGSFADGWGVVTVYGYPLGLVKATGGTLKNHYPKGLRLRT